MKKLSLPDLPVVALALFVLVTALCVTPAQGNAAAKLLFKELIQNSKRNYNKEIRPVQNGTETMIVKVGLRLSQIVDLDEKNLLLTTNVWVVLEWMDRNLTWNPAEFGNNSIMYIPIEDIWHPEYVLFNSADGTYEMQMKTKAEVRYDGTVKWRPPTTFKSSCDIEVKFFPFDEQICRLTFGSWTYNIEEVDFVHIDEPEIRDVGQTITVGIDLRQYYLSMEWDLMAAPAWKGTRLYAGSIKEFAEWNFELVLRRKFLFYLINLIIPLVSHAFLTILVFYLPSASQEKVSLCISIMLSLIVYFLMLSETIPQSSLLVPLMAQYLIFTMLLVTISIIVTAITLNIHFRSSATHVMPDWIRKIFLYFLPRILMMRRPKIENSHDVHLRNIKINWSCTRCFTDCIRPLRSRVSKRDTDYLKYQFGSKRTKTQTELINLSRELDEVTMTSGPWGRSIVRYPFYSELQRCIDSAIFIANHLKEEDEFNRTREDWKYVALVVDRLFLWAFAAVLIIGTLAIIMKAPSIYDDRVPITDTLDI